ncbi:hypothetical protein HID58_079757, partial [Brassica napus]
CRFSPKAISKAIRRKPYRDRVPSFSSPVISPITTNLVSPSCRRVFPSVTTWDHIFSDHIFSDNIFSDFFY